MLRLSRSPLDKQLTRLRIRKVFLHGPIRRSHVDPTGDDCGARTLACVRSRARTRATWCTSSPCHELSQEMDPPVECSRQEGDQHSANCCANKGGMEAGWGSSRHAMPV